MAGNKIKALDVPLRDRTHIIGYAEFAGYLGVSPEIAKRDYADKGLRPMVYGCKNRWEKAVVDQWVRDHDESQHVDVR